MLSHQNTLSCHVDIDVPEKFSHSLAWEDKLAAFGDVFQVYQNRLHTNLALHTSITMHAVDTKIDMIIFMRQLQDPRERRAGEFIEANGGLTVVAGSAVLMDKLQEIVGGDAAITATDLRREINTSVDEMIKANEEVFERKLKVQTALLAGEKNLAVQREGDRIVKAFRGQQVYERLADWVSTTTLFMVTNLPTDGSVGHV